MAMEKFHWTFKVPVDGDEDEEDFEAVKVALIKFDQIPFGVIRSLRKLPREDQFFTLLEKVIPEKELDKLDRIPQVQVNKFMEAWQKDAGVELGESSAS